MPMPEGTVNVKRGQEHDIVISASNDTLFNYVYHKFASIAHDIAVTHTKKDTNLVTFSSIYAENGDLKSLANVIEADNLSATPRARAQAFVNQLRLL